MKTRRREAVILWLVLAFLVWNVVFDRILVLAGRRYSYAAALAAGQAEGYVRIDDWMRPAVAHGVRLASLAGLSVAIVGLGAIAIASRFDQRRTRPSTTDRRPTTDSPTGDGLDDRRRIRRPATDS